MLIGLTGKKRAGKDTAAARLIDEHGFTRLAFADPLKAVAARLPVVIPTATGGERLSSLLASRGWEQAKERPEVRALLQDLGLAMREEVDEDIWTLAIRNRARRILDEGGSVVITDVRFPNELDLIEDLGGFHVHIDRPGLVASDPHPSETALEPYYASAIATISNGDTLAALKCAVDEVVEVLLALEGARA